jgi:hypothetical protein
MKDVEESKREAGKWMRRERKTLTLGFCFGLM